MNLDLVIMLRMMEIEGLTPKEIEKNSQARKPIPFKKVTLLLFVEDDKPGQYYIDESF